MPVVNIFDVDKKHLQREWNKIPDQFKIVKDDTKQRWKPKLTNQ